MQSSDPDDRTSCIQVAWSLPELKNYFVILSFTSLRDFAKPPVGLSMLMRTPGNVAVKKQVSDLMYVLIYV